MERNAAARQGRYDRTGLDAMRTVNTCEYISMLRELVQEGRSVNLLVSGNSMSPFLISQRDYVSFKAPDRPLRKGDIVFFQRDDGRFIMHRIIRVHREADGRRSYKITGDNQTQLETVREDQIFGLIFAVERKGKKIVPGDFWWEFFARVWTRIIPFRRAVKRLYGLCFWKHRKEAADDPSM